MEASSTITSSSGSFSNGSSNRVEFTMRTSKEGGDAASSMGGEGSRTAAAFFFPLLVVGTARGGRVSRPSPIFITFRGMGDGRHSSVPPCGCTIGSRPSEGVMVTVRGVSWATSLSRGIKDLPPAYGGRCRATCCSSLTTPFASSSLSLFSGAYG